MLKLLNIHDDNTIEFASSLLSASRTAMSLCETDRASCRWCEDSGSDEIVNRLMMLTSVLIFTKRLFFALV